MDGAGSGLGHVEALERGNGFVVVAGWVAAPVPMPGAALLLALSGSFGCTAPIAAKLPRPDLDESFGVGCGFGFHVALDWPDAAPAPDIWRVRLDDVEIRLDVSGRPVGFRPRGRIDTLDGDQIAGWVFDPGEARHGGRAALYLEGHAIPVDLREFRADLPWRDGARPPRYGFRLSLPDLARALRGADPAATLFDGRSRSVALLSAGQELDAGILAVSRDTAGWVERIGGGCIQGWAAEAGRPGTACELDIALNGIRYRTIRADQSRPDLVAQGLAGGGFAALLPARSPDDGPELAVSLHPAHAAQALPGEPGTLPAMAPRQADRRLVLHLLPPPGGPGVTVIVPIHNAAAELARCIASVVRHTTLPARLLLIDDASTDPAVAAVLAGWEGRPGLAIHRSPVNLGYTAVCNLGLEVAGTDDVVLLNSDTEVGPGWLEGLRIAAHSTPMVATVTPLSDNAGAFSAPEIGVANVMPAWFTTEDAARLVRQASRALYPEVPTGNGFCLYIRRAAIDAVGNFDAVGFPRGYGEENDFCLRALRAGFVHLIDDRSFVHHRRSASFGAERTELLEAARDTLRARYPEYQSLTSIFEDDPDLLAIRWRIRRAVLEAARRRSVPRPRVLFVISTRSGGTPLTNRDLMHGLSDRYEPWVLRCDSRIIELTRLDGEDETLVEREALDRPILPSVHRAAGYDARIADMLLRHAIELVHVRHIAWHGLGLIEVCRALGIPVVFSFHDFYTVCPTTKLLDESMAFCGGRCTPGPGPCKPELWPPELVPPLKHRFVRRWQEMMAGPLAGCDAFVTTSAGTRDIILDAFPTLRAPGIRVIPHGRSFESFGASAFLPAPGERLRVLVPGNISAAKGAALIRDMAALDGEGAVEFHLLGDLSAELDGVTSPLIIRHGPYERDDFHTHIRRIRPHLGAVLSLWAETWCHTLTEMWAAGLPVLALGIGAVGERIGRHGGGWLLAPGAEPATILQRLLALRQDPAEVQGRGAEVVAWQQEHGRHYDIAAMACEYDQLFRAVLARRRVLADPQASPACKVLVPTDAMAPPGELAERCVNHVARRVIFRPASPASLWTGPEATPADAVLLRPAAIMAAEAEDAAAQSHAAGRSLLVELDEDPVALLGTGSVAQARAEAILTLTDAAALVITPDATLRARLAELAPHAAALPRGLPPRLWPLRPAEPGSTGVLRVLCPTGPGAIALEWLDAVLAGLAVHLTVAAEPADWTAHDLAVAPLAPGDPTDAAFETGVLRAMAAGLPVIASATAAMASAPDGVPALFLDGADWSAAVRRLADAPRLRAVLGRRGRDFIRAERLLRPAEDPLDRVIAAALSRQP